MFLKPWILWPTFPMIAGLLTLVNIRSQLFKNNLYDTNPIEFVIDCPEQTLSNRTLDGSCNHLENTSMGMKGMNFGRNVPLAETIASDGQLLEPNPRQVSLDLMTRDKFIPATSVNFLTAAWVQFLSHDLFFHGESDYLNPIAVPLAEDDPFQQDFMYIPRTRVAPNSDLVGIRAFSNHVTHWWDGSSLYGSDKDTSASIRTFQSGKLKINEQGSLYYDLFGKPVTGFTENWWVGLELIHSLFTAEHNAIADKLSQSYPDWTDEELFHKARLINAAVMAKVHIFGWSTAMIDTPAVKAAMGVNWHGLLGEKIKSANIKLPSAVLSGILGNKTNLAGVPYTITEEFVSVYRMHSLIRDELPIRSHRDGQFITNVDMIDTRDDDAQTLVENHGLTNLFYSFGTSHPGAIVLNNHPKFMQNLSIPLLQNFDLAAVDVLRDRERGVPRYNEFRRLVHLRPIQSFEDFDLDQATTEKLKTLYNNNIELIDLQIGALAEPKLKGFAFGETFFQIFVGMASRRLMADRFFTVDYRQEIYTEEGMQWIEAASFKNVILRHMPELSEKLNGIENAFKPWKK